MPLEVWARLPASRALSLSARAEGPGTEWDCPVSAFQGQRHHGYERASTGGTSPVTGNGATEVETVVVQTQVYSMTEKLQESVWEVRGRNTISCRASGADGTQSWRRLLPLSGGWLAGSGLGYPAQPELGPEIPMGVKSCSAQDLTRTFGGGWRPALSLLIGLLGWSHGWGLVQASGRSR